MIEPVIIGNCTLYNADCLEIAGSLPKKAAIVSDPPYGMKWDGKVSPGKNGHGGAPRTRHHNVKIIGDDRSFDPFPWLDYPEAILWGSNHYAAKLPLGTTLVWIKRNEAGYGSFLSDAEIAWKKGGHGVYCHKDTSMYALARQRLHPAQKPVGMLRWCIAKTKSPIIIDPYMGVGSTGLASLAEGRQFIGVELDRAYFEIACKRIQEAINNKE